MLLSELAPGDEAFILRVRGLGARRLRLMEMGLVPGTRVVVRKTAPMGDPLEIGLRGYVLTLRRSDAAEIEIHAHRPDR